MSQIVFVLEVLNTLSLVKNSINLTVYFAYSKYHSQKVKYIQIFIFEGKKINKYGEEK